MENNIHQPVPLKIISLCRTEQTQNSRKLQNSTYMKNRLYKNQGSAFINFLKFRKINNQKSLQGDCSSASACLKNLSTDSAISEDMIRPKSTILKINKNQQFNFYTTSNPEASKNSKKLHRTLYSTKKQSSSLARPKTSFSNSGQPQGRKAIIKNYFPMRKVKKNKDTRWQTYFSTKQINVISLQIENKRKVQKQRENFLRFKHWDRERLNKTQFRFNQNETLGDKCFHNFTSQFGRCKSNFKQIEKSQRSIFIQVAPWNTNTNDNQKQIMAELKIGLSKSKRKTKLI